VLDFGVGNELGIVLDVMDGKTLGQADGTVLGSGVGYELDIILGSIDFVTLG